MTRDLANILSVFQGSSGDATIALYDELRGLGPAGTVALELFRAQKSSSRAKVYRGGGFRGKAYDKKQWAMDNLARALTELGALPWGWKLDPKQEFHNWVLYVDLPNGQVSFHTAARGAGPDFAGDWDGVKDASATRVCRYIADLFSPRQRKWRVVTRAIVERHYLVTAENEKAAEAASCDATPDHEEDENEETMSICEVPA